MSSTNLIKLCKTKTNYFKHLELETDSECKPDQCIIIDERFLSHISGFEYVKRSPEKSAPLDWYPLVNSYYNHAEDVDIFERVNKLLTGKPSLMSIRSDNESYYETDPYSEKDAQLQYLSSRPVCFLMMGKPGIGQEDLAKKLADHWKCVYIEPETLIKEEIASGTRAGECIEFNLRCGRAIGIDIILRLIEKRIKSKSAQHRGFVITGIPLVPNELYEEDPVSSESAVFNVQEIFEDIFELVIDIGVPAQKHVSIISSRMEKSVADEEDEQKFPKEEEMPPDIDETASQAKQVEKLLLDVGSAHGNVCKKPEISTNCEEQLHFIFGLLEDPLMVIYIKCGNDDVISKRDSYRFDIYTDTTIDLQAAEVNATIHSLYSKDLGANSYEVPIDLFDEVHYTDISRLQHLVMLPRNFPANVAGQLNIYHIDALDSIEQYILCHDPQYYLKIDGRASKDRMFNILKLRLEILPLQKVLLPEKLNTVEPPKEGEEFDVYLVDMKDMSLEECYRKLRRKQVPNNMFKWTWSDWGTKCPVSMKEGFYKDGDPNLAVHFMNRMFFLADEDAFWKFYKNPRPYLLPPYPKPSCRIFIFGPDASGKTTIAKGLAYLLNGTVLSVDVMKDNYVQQKKDEYKEMLRQAAMIEAITILNSEREAKRQYRGKLIEFWIDLIKTALRDYKIKEQAADKHDVLNQIELVIDIKTQGKFKLNYRDPPVYLEVENDEDLKVFLEDSSLLNKYLPNELNSESRIDEPASVVDEFVTTYANEASQAPYEDTIEFDEETLVEMFTNNLKLVEERSSQQGNNRGGWIVDGMLPDLNILEKLFPDYIADDVFILRDQDNYLLYNYNFEGRSTYRDYRQYFLDSGKVDAAWRAPGPDSTTSMRQGLVREILYDVIRNKYTFKDGSELGEADEEIVVPSWAKSVDSYADRLRDYNDYLKELMDFFTEKQIIPVEIDVTGKSLLDLLDNVVRNIQNRYRTNPARLEDQDRYEEAQDFGSPNMPEGEGLFEGIAEPTEDVFAKNRRYGDTFWYCPVTLHDKFVLWKGKEECAATFEDKIYLCSNEDDLDAFMSDPKKYIFGNKVPTKIPPVRICVIGAKGVGKTTVSKKLADNIGINYIDFVEFVKTCSAYDEQAVNNYLTGSATLPESILSQFVNKLWFEEPLKYIGFVVDSFPKHSSDVSFMISVKAIPDVILLLQIPQSELRSRLVDQATDEHLKQMEMEKSIQEEINRGIYDAWRRDRAKRYEEMMEERRQRRYTKKRLSKKRKHSARDPDDSGDAFSMSSAMSNRSSRSASVKSQVTYDSFAEQKDQEEIEALLDKEMPEPVFDEFEDDLEEFIAAFEENIEQELSLAYDYITEVEQLCESEFIPWTELDSKLTLECLVYQALIATDGLKNRNISLFERCYDITFELAEQLLSYGYYFLSKFGKTCPVQYFKKVYPPQLYIPMKEKNRLFPVIHRQFIYFLAGEENCLDFKKNPLKYVNITKFCFPLIPYRIAVIGPPKCGKTTLAKRIQNEYSFKLISCGQAMRFALRYLQSSKLAKQLDAWLRLGNSSTHKMQMDSVEAAFYDPYSVTQGIIFDGFPNNQREVEILRDSGLVPHLILYLETSDEDVHERLDGLKSFRNLPVFSRGFFDIRFNFWKENFPSYFIWMDREYQNIRTTPTNLSFWHAFSESQKVLLAVASEIKHYYTHAHEDWPLRIANMLITPLEYLERQSEYKSFCPSCLYYDKILKSGNDIPDRTTLVHFMRHFYWICEQHIESFLKCPEKFLRPYNCNTLPLELPKKPLLTAMPPPEQLHEEGICMVCYSKDKEKKRFIYGNIHFAITYQGIIYLFDIQECMDAFMAQPQLYASQVIPYKDPKSMASLKYDELPILGFLEQYVAKDIVKAINHVVNLRPVVPGLSIAVSASIDIGIFFKLNNPNVTTYRKEFEQAEALFNDRRICLIDYLKKMKRFRNPFIYYEEPLPKFKEYTPQDKARECARKILSDILDKINYNLTI